MLSFASLVGARSVYHARPRSTLNSSITGWSVCHELLESVYIPFVCYSQDSVLARMLCHTKSALTPEVGWQMHFVFVRKKKKILARGLC